MRSLAYSSISSGVLWHLRLVYLVDLLLEKYLISVSTVQYLLLTTPLSFRPPLHKQKETCLGLSWPTAADGELSWQHHIPFDLHSALQETKRLFLLVQQARLCPSASLSSACKDVSAWGWGTLPAPASPRTKPAVSGITGKEEVWFPPLITKELVQRLCRKRITSPHFVLFCFTFCSIVHLPYFFRRHKGQEKPENQLGYEWVFSKERKAKGNFKDPPH